MIFQFTIYDWFKDSRISFLLEAKNDEILKWLYCQDNMYVHLAADCFDTVNPILLTFVRDLSGDWKCCFCIASSFGRSSFCPHKRFLKCSKTQAKYKRINLIWNLNILSSNLANKGHSASTEHLVSLGSLFECRLTGWKSISWVAAFWLVFDMLGIKRSGLFCETFQLCLRSFPALEVGTWKQIRLQIGSADKLLFWIQGNLSSDE